MKKLAILFIAAITLLGVSSCEKPYQTTQDLAVDYSDDYGGLVFPNSKLAECYIFVTSNTSWTATVEEQKWCGFIPKDQLSLSSNRFYTYSGNGSEYIRFSINENYSVADRHVVFTVTNANGKVKSFTIHQPGASVED